MNPFYQNEEFALNRNPAVFLFVYHFLLSENGVSQSRNVKDINIKNSKEERPRRQCSVVCRPSLSSCMEYI